MSAKHTKGPWIVWPEEEDEDYLRIRGQALGYRFKIANVLCPGSDDFERLTSEWQETKANARLIAAAPELLAALQELIAADEWRERAWDGAKEAIAKATGGAA